MSVAVELFKLEKWLPITLSDQFACVTVAKIAHICGLEGNSAKCTGILKNTIDSGINDYAGNGVDSVMKTIEDMRQFNLTGE